MSVTNDQRVPGRAPVSPNVMVNLNEATPVSCCPSFLSTMVEVARFRAEQQPEQCAYQWLDKGEIESRSLTYAELDKRARSIAAVIQQQKGLQQQYPTAAIIAMQPGLDFTIAFFGCLYAGVAAVPVYPLKRKETGERIAHVIADASATVILTDIPSLEPMLDKTSMLIGVSILIVDENDQGHEAEWVDRQVAGDDVAFIQYTSGSTGVPKGVVVTHSNLMSNERMVEEGFGHSKATVFVGWLPLYHDMGLIGNMLQPFYLGVLCVLMSPVAFVQKPIRWLRAINKYRGTTSGGPNFGYDLCVTRTTAEQRAGLDLSCWRVAYNGAEPVRAQTLRDFAEVFADYGFRAEAIYPCYGMAEGTLFITGGPSNQMFNTINADKRSIGKDLMIEMDGHSLADINHRASVEFVDCGQPWRDCQVRIVNPATQLSCSSHEIGEIWVSGSHVAQCYKNQPQKSDETFNAFVLDEAIDSTIDSNRGPYLRTGDLGFLKNGRLFVTGRLKDIIIINGRNHYPQDIELTVSRCHPALLENATAAFQVSDNHRDKLVVVQEVSRGFTDAAEIKTLTLEIIRTVSAVHEVQVSDVVLIRQAKILKTSSGKIRRKACLEMYLNDGFERITDTVEYAAEHSAKNREKVA